MTPLVKFIWVLLLLHTKPGGSPYSMETLPECGTDPKAATCEVKPKCANKHDFRCAPPRWSAGRKAWVTVETRDQAAERYREAAYAAVRASVYLTRCKDELGRVVEDCKPVHWPEGPRSLAMALLGSSIWESGYREDIMTGAPPMGRGSLGEACVMQIMPAYIKQYSHWLTPEQRRPAPPPGKTEGGMTDEKAAQLLLGADRKALTRCYTIGGRMLARARRHARGKCRGSSIYGMYAIYGTGGRCYIGATAARKDWAGQRADTYKNFMGLWKPRHQPKPPKWAAPLLTRK